jgi:glycosyltransferase involved in cell wall biosynthesis
MTGDRRRLKITFLTNRPGLSGGARVIGDYAAYLHRQGHEVRVFAQPDKPRRLLPRLKATLKGEPPAAPRPSPFFDPLGDRFVRLPRSGKPRDADLPDADVIIATFWNTAEHVAALPSAKGAKAYFMQDYGAAGQPIDDVRKTWTLGLKMITISRYLQNEIECASGEKSILVLNGVDPSFMAPSPRSFRDGPPTVGFLYSTNAMKGSRDCIAAAVRARETIPDLRVLSFGPKAPADAGEMPAWVEFRPKVSEAEARTIYGACDAWLFGSIREGFGLPILEAMAGRTPVIAARSAAAPDLLRHGGGRLVPVSDPVAMAAAIIELCRLSPADWRALSEAAFKTASRYSIDAARARFEDALYAIADGRFDEAARAA